MLRYGFLFSNTARTLEKHKHISMSRKKNLKVSRRKIKDLEKEKPNDKDKIVFQRTT